MKVSLRFPAEHTLRSWLARRIDMPFSYPEVGQSAREFPAGYNHDRNAVKLGEGKEMFEAAKAALLSWKMFPEPWTTVFPSPIQLAEGQEVAVMFRLFGVWWWNSCRIVYTFDEPNRYGFAYGTLNDHVEKGEEIFYLSFEEDGSVWYRIEAFSRPRWWPLKILKPYARMMQRKFVRESKKGMKGEEGVLLL